MSDEDLEKSLKDFLLNMWKNNPVFRDNLAFLNQVHLRSLPEKIILDILERTEDLYKYELSRSTAPPPILQVLDREETLNLLLKKPKSFCRYGDGEFELIRGNSIAFQEYDENLSLRLKEILASSQENCYVGINHFLFHFNGYPNQRIKDYFRMNARDFRQILFKYAYGYKIYIDSCVTTTCPHRDNPGKFIQEKFDWFEKIKTLFERRKLVIVSGSTVFNNIKYNVFEKAASCVHLFASSKNAWFQYEEILAKLKTIPKDYTICAILGPTATVLAYDLAQEGYTAWDIGHLAKLYDAVMKDGGVKNHKAFFDPD